MTPTPDQTNACHLINNTADRERACGSDAHAALAQAVRSTKSGYPALLPISLVLAPGERSALT